MQTPVQASSQKVPINTKESVFYTLKGHLRKISILLLNLLLNREIVFRVIGWINERYHCIGSIFVAYPASEDYANAYVYHRHRSLMQWQPWPVGVLWQNSKWGLVFVISSTEGDFLNPANRDNLETLVRHTERIQHLIGAPQKTFAGILPGVLFSKRLIRDAVETDVTVEAIVKAEQRVREIEGHSNDTPIIILGGLGFVGRRLIAKLKGRDIYCVDVANGGDRNNWPQHLIGKNAILVNVTRKTALSQYTDLFWPELVLLNEVYPEPSKYELTKLTTIGCSAYHLVGIKGKSFPPFPRAYAGGIPCCAGQKSQQLEVIIKKLN